MITILDTLKHFEKPSDHALYGPSSADRWIGCPASIQLSEGIIQETSKYAAEGTLAHSVCEAIFRESYFGIQFPLDLKMDLLNLEDRGEEMLYCAHNYLDVLNAWLKKKELGDILWWGVERGIPIFPERQCFGTGDFVIVGSRGAAIIDFKYGKGKEVSAGSSQLQTYALGIYNYVKGLPADYKFHTVVYQPRISLSPKEAVYDIQQMEAWKNIILKAIDESKKPLEQLTLKIDSNKCFWCPANRTKDRFKKCPAQREKVLSCFNNQVADFQKDMMISKASPEDVSWQKRDEALVNLLALYPLIKQVAEEAEEEIKHRLMEGESVPFASLRQKTGRRQWAHSDEDMVAELRKRFPADLPNGGATTKIKAPSITEVEKAIGKGSVDDLIVKKQSKEVVVQDSKVKHMLEQMNKYIIDSKGGTK